MCIQFAEINICVLFVVYMFQRQKHLWDVVDYLFYVALS